MCIIWIHPTKSYGNVFLFDYQKFLEPVFEPEFWVHYNFLDFCVRVVYLQSSLKSKYLY